MDHSLRRPLIGIPAASLETSAASTTPQYRFNGSYPAVLAAAGAAPVVIPLALPEAALQAIFDDLDGLCLAGGDDVDPTYYGEERHPALGKVDAARDTTELALARWALAVDLPVLGICRGIQLLNVAAGGSLYQDVAAQVPGARRHSYMLAESPWEQYTQRVRLAEDSRLAHILGSCDLPTNSFHHQAVKQPGEGIRAVAWSEDGVIEGIEAPGHLFATGVQWHPEGMYAADVTARKLFAAFVAAARQRMAG